MKLSIFVILIACLASLTCCLADNSVNDILVGTKTGYTTARNYLAQLINSSSRPQNFVLETLEQLDGQLRNDGYEPTLLYVIARHSVRFPEAELMLKYDQDLLKFQNIIKKTLEVLGDRAETYSNQLYGRDLLKRLIEWKPKWNVQDSNQITNQGLIEGQSIARHFKSVYPSLFDGQKTDINLGFSSRMRTAQSGMDFLREIDNFQLEDCENLSKTPLDIEDLYTKPNIHSHKDKCAQRLVRDYYWPSLEFHLSCKEIYGGKMPLKMLSLKRMKAMKVFSPAKDRLKSSFEGLPLGEFLGGEGTNKLFGSIFDVCKFESAMFRESDWCLLLSKEELDQLEYIKDADAYYTDGYGETALPKQSCPVIKDLLERLAESSQIDSSFSTSSSSRASVDEPKLKTYLHFTHSDAMKKMIAVFNLFNNPSGYTDFEMESFLAGGSVPKNRQWLTSVLVPFSSNLSFVLYRKPIGPVNEHKILVLVNERPVHVEGCSTIDCNLDQFLATYADLLDCDLSKICAPPNE